MKQWTSNKAGCWWRAVAGVVAGLALSRNNPAAAQAPAGATLREVTRLERVAEPPGGLVPYRKGQLWGYADTTGRLVIRPAFAWLGIEDGVFFQEGFMLTGQFVPVGVVQWLPGQPTPAPTEQWNLVYNARGEFLRVRPYEAAVRQPDGSLRVLPRWQAHGQWALRPLGFSYPESIGFTNWQFRRLRPADDVPVNLPAEAHHIEYLGANRVCWQLDILAPPVAGQRPTLLPNLYGLFTMAGQRLTGYSFEEIQPFSEGRAAFQPAGSESLVALPLAGRRPKHRTAPAYFGYLDTLGRVVIAPQFQRATAFRHGRAVVTDSLGRDAIINAQGKYLLPPGPTSLDEADAAGYIRQQVPVSPGSRRMHYRYLPPAGRAALALRYADAAGPFQQGRAWVRVGSRRGLIDAAGHWVTLLAYEQLWTPARLRPAPVAAEEPGFDPEPLEARDLGYPLPDSREAAQSVPSLSYPRPDAAYLLARRAGKYGVVSRRTGREVVPASYDEVLAGPLHGTVCLRRTGHDYVISLFTGQAVEAEYYGIDFLTPQGRRLYVLRRQPASWALLDTTGHLRTAWLPATSGQPPKGYIASYRPINTPAGWVPLAGFPTPQGWLLCQEAGRWTLRDATGRLGYTSKWPIEQLASDARWVSVQQSLSRAWDDDTDWPYWQLPLPAPGPQVRAAYCVRDPVRGVGLLDARLRELGQPPLPLVPPAPVKLVVLPSHWSYLVPANFNPDSLGAVPKELRLYTDDGQLLPPPTGGAWAYFQSYFYYFDYPRAWREHGVLPTTQGYLTRGRRPLWAD